MTIQKLQESGRLPHAVLLLGGDAAAADELIAMHECDTADAVFVKNEMPDEKYKVEPLREIVASGNLRPQFGDTRVFVFADFDTMSVPCQNTLLKFIEEPPQYNRFVLTAASKLPILPTILSRVVSLQSEGADALDTPNNTAVSEIAEAITAAIKNRDKAKAEYDTAAAFSRVKDRQTLSDVLERLLNEFAALMTSARKPEKIINATDVLQKYIKRTEVNPNVPMTTASCAAELHTALHS
jgi:DNA polymerase III delta prime subunit